MAASDMRRKLHHFIDTIEEKKVKAIYTLFEDEIEQEEMEYTEEFKKELDRRYAYYINGGKMVTAAESEKQIRELLKKGKRK